MATITSLTFQLNSIYNGNGVRQARRDMANLDTAMSAMSKAQKNLAPGMREVVSLILGLGPALVPIVAGLAGLGGAAVSAFTLAGAAVGIYAMALKGAITATIGTGSAFKDTQGAIDRAERSLRSSEKGTKEYTAAQKDLTKATLAHEDAIRKMPPVQEAFARAFDGAKASISAFNDENAAFTLGPATTMVEAFVDALPKVTPLLKAMGPVVQQVADNFRGWVNDGGLDRFIRTLIDYGVPALKDFIQFGANLFGSLGNGLRTFAPMGLEFTQWLVDASRKFAMWTNGGGFGRFVSWLVENGPQLIQVAKDFAKFLGNVGTAVGDMSENALIVFGAFLKVLASFPPGLIQAIAYAWITWNAALIVYNTVAFIAAAASAAILLWLSPMGPLLLGIAASALIWIAAIAAVGVAIYFLVKYWDQVWAAIKTAALVVWDALKAAWEATWNFVRDIAVKVWGFLTEGWGQVLLAFMGPIGLIILVAKHWDVIWTGIKDTALTVWTALRTAWDATVGWLLDRWNAATGPIRESWGQIWPELKEAAVNVWNGLKIAWDVLWTGITFVWDAFWSSFGPAFKTGWSGLTSTAVSTWKTLTSAWELVWSVITGIYETGFALLKGAWDIGWSFLTGTAKIAWAVLTGAWSVVWSVVRGVWDTFYAIFSGIFTTAWKVIVALATGAWDVLKAAWDVLWKSVTAIFMTFLAIFTGNWGAAWNSIKDAAAAIWTLIKTAWSAFLNVIMTALTGFINTAKATWSAFWQAVQNTATTFWTALKNLFQTSLTAVQNLWTTVWTAVRTFFQTTVNAVVTAAQAFWTTLRNAFSTGLTAVKSLWETVWTAIRTFFQTVSTGVQTIASALWTALRDIFSAGSTWLRTTFWNPVNNFFTKTIPGAFDAAAKALGKAWDSIRKLVRDPIQAIVNVVYNNGIVKLWNAVAGLFGASDLKTFTLPQFKEGGPTGAGSSNGFLARVHPNEHVWTAQEVAGAGGHEAVARLRRQAMGGAPVRTFGEHSFEDGGGILGTGFGPDVGPDLVPDGIIKNALGKLKDLALGAISGPFGAAVDGVAKLGKTALRAVIPGKDTAMEKLGVGMIDKIATTIKDWVTQNDVAPVGAGGNGFVPWKAWQAGDGTHQNYGGVTVNRRTAAMLNNAVKIAKTSFSMFQGSYSSAVAASAGTHSGGGAVDLGPAKDSIVGAMRASGFAAWRRTPAEGFSPHIHGIAVGDPTVSAGAAQQVRDFHNGLNGLAGGGKDTYTAPGGSGGTSPSAAKATAKAMLGNYGWASHWSALEALWTRESGWNYKAKNPSSGAYGIPQSLPASKMKSAGADYLTNPATQIKWGLGYIKGRYGNPTKANSFQKANNWYATGTPGANSGWATVGEQGMERIRLRGGERIDPMRDLIRETSSSGDTHVTVEIDARGATVAAVDKLQSEFPDTLRVALAQGVGKKS